MPSPSRTLQAEPDAESSLDFAAGELAAPPTAAPPGLALKQRAWKLAASPSLLAPLDQAVVSGTRFLTTILIGRLCGPDVLGSYALAFAVVVFAVCGQESLIARPYLVYRRKRPPGEARQFAGNVLVHHLVFMLVVGAGLLAATGAAFVRQSGLVPVLLALSFAVPAALLWEFARRYCFAHMRMATALVIDGCVSMLLLGGLLALGAGGLLTAQAAYWLLGAASLLVGLAALARFRGEFEISRATLWRDWRQNWAFGRWGLAGQFTGAVQSYTVHWLLALMCGAAATGVFAACQTIVLLTNPLLLGFANLLGPRAAEAQAKDGVKGVFRSLRSSTLTLTALTVAFSGFVFVFAETLLGLLFGPGYAGYGPAVGIMGLTAIGMGWHIAWASGLSALDRPQVMFQATLAGLTLTLVAGLFLIGPFGIVGASWALVIGSYAVALVEALALRRIWNEEAAR